MAIKPLTWNLVGPKHFASGSDLNKPPKKNQLMATYLDLIKSSSYWDVSSLDITGSCYEAIVVKPITSSLTPHIRAIITFNATGSLNQWQARLATTAETDEAGHLQVGFTPDITQGSGSYNSGNYLSDNPFGNDTRWSKYWSGGRLLNSSGAEQCFLIESSESLFVGMRGRKNNYFGTLFGAIIESFTSGSGEKNKRIFGMACTGNTAIPTAIWNTTANVFLKHSAASHTNHFGTFIKSGSSANGPGAHQWQLATPNLLNYTVTAAADSIPGPNTTPWSNVLVGIPISYKRSEDPQNIVGMLRQICMMQDFTSLSPIITSSLGNFVGLTLGNDTFAATDAIFFVNKKT